MDPIEERIRLLEQSVIRLESTLLADDKVAAAEIENIKEDVDALKLLLSEKVHLSRYIVVERIVFGLVGLTLISVFTALLALVLRGA